jgi:hypothetical protein
MAKVVGNIGTNINGILYVKPSAPFLGVEAGYRAHPVTDGLIDIELAPTPRGVFYLVDFQPEGSFTNPNPQEKWTIPPVADVPLDSLRFPRQRRLTQAIAPQGNHFAEVELNLLRQEKAQLEEALTGMRERLTTIQEEREATTQKLESARAEVAELKTKLYLMGCPHETVVEKLVKVPVVERISNQEMAREIQTLSAMVTALRAENERLLAQLQTAIANAPAWEEPPPPQRQSISATATPVEQLDYLLRQREGMYE